MKKLFIIAAFLLLPFTVLAEGYENGDDGCERNCNNTSTTNKGGKGGTGVGIGIGIGKGGSAYSKAYGGNAKAYGGNAYSKGGSAYQGQDQGQSQLGINSQTGIVKNVGSQVVITDESVTIFEEKYQAPSMVAPGIDTSQVNVECPLFVQDGWSGSLSGPGAGASAGATDAEAIPTCFALLAAKNSTGEAKKLAGAAFYCLAFEAAGVDNYECDGWRDAVRGGPAPAVRDSSVREGR